MKKIWIPQAIIIPMLLLALNPNYPYGYYTLLRWVCCAAFVYLAIHAFTREKQGWGWVLGVTAAIYNPILPVHGTREMRTVVNVVTIGLAVASLFTLKYDTETIRREPDVADTYFNQGIAKFLLGEYSAAIAHYDKAIQLKPDYANAYSSRGFAKAQLCQYDAAITDYTQAIRLKPDNAEAYKNRGIAKENLGEHGAAIQDYDTAIRLTHNYAPAYINRGFARAILGWTEEGKQDLRTALKFAEQAGNDTLKDKIELNLQRFEEWVALEKRSKGTSMTFEEAQREFGTALTLGRTDEIQDLERLDFEVMVVDRGSGYSEWAIYQDGKNIGGFSEWHGEVYKEEQVMFFASDTKQTYSEVRKLSTHESIRSTESDIGETSYCPSFNTLAELLDHIEQQVEI